MIELIVLGIVPGTQLQIDFTHVATTLWLSFIAYCIITSKRNTPKNNTPA